MTAAQEPATSQESQRGKGSRGTPGDATAPTPKRRRWPIWSESQRGTICNICGFDDRQHSSVCPFGPEPTKSRERR